jgi:hypothetical protein
MHSIGSSAGARRLFATSVIARLPLAMLSIGLVVHIQHLTGSFGAAVLVTGVYAIAEGVGGPVLILDEPTVGMDVEARRGFWVSVRGFAARGKTVVFATHYMEEADAYADRVILMADGLVVADGATSEIRSRVGRRTIRATLPGGEPAGEVEQQREPMHRAAFPRRQVSMSPPQAACLLGDYKDSGAHVPLHPRSHCGRGGQFLVHPARFVPPSAPPFVARTSGASRRQGSCRGCSRGPGSGSGCRWWVCGPDLRRAWILRTLASGRAQAGT